MSKVTVVGAGAVGATCANVMACREVASEVVLIDIKEGLSEGKMLDMYQCSTLMDFDTKLVGVTNDYKQTANSDVVVITSGIPRKPGMTREELIGTNANIMKGVIENVVKYSPRAIIIVVANPMDTLTYLALKASGLPKNRIIGMGGALDSARFKCYLAKATGANINNVDGMVIGGHGDTTMIPLLSKASVNGVPVTQFASKKKLEEAVASTMVGGATLTKLIGTSAWYAPGAAASMMVESILHDQKKIVPCCLLPRRRIRPERHLYRCSRRDRPQGYREDRQTRPHQGRGCQIRGIGRAVRKTNQVLARDQGVVSVCRQR